jgi:2-phospho-L-lactate/phosphoenolpyruvate guanylyltransferase
MTCQIVIPVQPPEEGKTRLAPVLDGQARAALIERMFRHVLSAAIRSLPTAQVHVVSRSQRLLDLARASGALAVCETGRGLNAALAQAAAVCAADLPLLVLSADLPFLEPEDIAAILAAQTRADVVAATDRAGQGTNALFMHKPLLTGFAFGEGSLARHRELAQKAAQRFAVIERPGLSMDIDEPADLRLFER